MTAFGDAVRDWHDFFLALAEVSASLTGLLFVAVTLRPRSVSDSGVFEVRAFSALVGLLSVTLASLLMLLPRPYTRWAVLAAGAMAAAQILYSLPRRREATSTSLGRNRRIVYDLALLVVVAAGALALVDVQPGVAFLLIALGDLALIALAASAAWLMISPSSTETHLLAEDEAPRGGERKPPSGSSPAR